MPDTLYRQGEPLMVDHTPGTAVALGDVRLLTDIVLISHRPISANVKGAMAAGGGVYTVTGDAAIAAGKKVWWNNTTKKITETATGNKVFGYTLTACAADNGTCEAVHRPEM